MGGSLEPVSQDFVPRNTTVNSFKCLTSSHHVNINISFHDCNHCSCVCREWCLCMYVLFVDVIS